MRIRACDETRRSGQRKLEQAEDDRQVDVREGRAREDRRLAEDDEARRIEHVLSCGEGDVDSV